MRDYHDYALIEFAATFARAVRWEFYANKRMHADLIGCWCGLAVAPAKPQQREGQLNSLVFIKFKWKNLSDPSRTMTGTISAAERT